VPERLEMRIPEVQELLEIQTLELPEVQDLSEVQRLGPLNE